MIYVMLLSHQLFECIKITVSFFNGLFVVAPFNFKFVGGVNIVHNVHMYYFYGVNGVAVPMRPFFWIKI